MKKQIFKVLWRRLLSKNPVIANIIASIATVLLVVFFGEAVGTESIYDLCDIHEFLCANKKAILAILLLIVPASQIPVSKKSKNYKKLKDGT